MGDHNDLGELLDMVSSKVPGLIGNILKAFYSAESGANIGKAVGSLYKELLEAGIPAEEALKMARDYMLSLKDLSKMINVDKKGGNDAQQD